MKLSTWTRFDTATDLPDGWRDTYATALTANAARPFPPGSATGGVRYGWCHADDLLGVDFGDLNVWSFNQYAAFALRVDTKKIPAAVFRAHLEERKRAWCRANNRERCPGAVRQELREQLVLELLAQVMPTLRSVPVVWNVAEGYVLVGTHADGHLDAARKLFVRTFGIALAEHVPGADLDDDIVMALTGMSAEESPMVAPETMAEFLRWLWEREARGNAEIDVDGEPLTWWVDDRIGLATKAGDKPTHTLRLDRVTTAAPTLAAIAEGESVASLRLMLRRSDREYHVTITPTLHPGSAKLPTQVKTGDVAERLYDQMFLAEELHHVLATLWRTFAELRASDRWGQAAGSAKAWLSEEIVRVFEVDEATGQTRLFGAVR